MKMICLIWFLSILAFLFADVRTGISQDRGFQRCYTCNDGNTTDCNLLDDLTQVNCSLDLPYCGTSAKSPDYISSLVCTAGGQTSPCTLIQTAMDIYEMTCTCDGHLCNKPFTREFRNELLNFSSTYSPDNMTRGLLETFMNSSAFSNITSANIYETVTIKTTQQTTNLPPVSPIPISSSTLSPSSFNNANVPRAEALKHEATVPSDDDEDEGEGSGTFEEAKPQAPAAPSSFLPANENTASSLQISLLATISFISLYTVA